MTYLNERNINHIIINTGILINTATAVTVVNVEILIMMVTVFL